MVNSYREMAQLSQEETLTTRHSTRYRNISTVITVVSTKSTVIAISKEEIED